MENFSQSGSFFRRRYIVFFFFLSKVNLLTGVRYPAIGFVGHLYRLCNCPDSVTVISPKARLQLELKLSSSVAIMVKSVSLRTNDQPFCSDRSFNRYP